MLSVEDDLNYIGFGPDDGGGNTRGLLSHLQQRFGPVSSFTGTYQADQWTLTLNRRAPDLSESVMILTLLEFDLLL